MCKSIEQMMKAINTVCTKYDGQRSRYEMRVSQVTALAQCNDKFQMISDAFNYGFYMGIKFQQNQDKKKKAPVTDQSAKGQKENSN